MEYFSVREAAISDLAAFIKSEQDLFSESSFPGGESGRLQLLAWVWCGYCGRSVAELAPWAREKRAWRYCTDAELTGYVASVADNYRLAAWRNALEDHFSAWGNRRWGTLQDTSGLVSAVGAESGLRRVMRR